MSNVPKQTRWVAVVLALVLVVPRTAMTQETPGELIRQGSGYLAEGQLSEAIVVLDRAVRLLQESGPKNELARARLLLGAALLQSRQRERARDELRKALAADSSVAIPAEIQTEALRELWAEVSREARSETRGQVADAPIDVTGVRAGKLVGFGRIAGLGLGTAALIGAAVLGLGGAAVVAAAPIGSPVEVSVASSAPASGSSVTVDPLGSGGQQARFSIGLSVLAQTTLARGEAYFVSQNRRCLGGSIEGVPAGVRTTVTLAGASNNGQNNAICALPFTSTAIEVIYPNQSPVSVSHSYTFAAR